MKKFFFTFAICLPMMAFAQNVWEMPKVDKTVDPDAPYLAGAVPVVDGRVSFDTTFVAPGKSANQIYNLVLGFLDEMTKEEGQFEASRVAFADSVSGEIGASFQEWLVFTRQLLSLDRTRFFYTIKARCQDGSADVTMTRIHYLYDEERNPQKYTAEEWITDEWGLRKNGKKLARLSGKFRKKTIDRKNYIFNELGTLLK